MSRTSVQTVLLIQLAVVPDFERIKASSAITMLEASYRLTPGYHGGSNRHMIIMIHVYIWFFFIIVYMVVCFICFCLIL